MNHKPSEQIEELRQSLINEDWVRFGGNYSSREEWRRKHNGGDMEATLGYSWRALMAYLDRQQSEKFNPVKS